MQLVKTYTYVDKELQKVGEVRRFEKGGKKEVKPYFNTSDSKSFKLGIPNHLKGNMPLYGIASIKDISKPIYIVEGEKCAQAIIDLGLQCVTSQGGSNAPQNSDWSSISDANHIYFLPDNDACGEKYIQKVSGVLRELENNPTNQMVLRFTHLEDKEDIVDFLQTFDELNGWNGLDSIGAHPKRDLIALKLLDYIDSNSEPYLGGDINTCEALTAIPANRFVKMQWPSREALMSPWLTKGSINMIFAERGVGKTQFGLGCAIALSKGEDFLWGKGIEPQKVLYLDGEMPSSLMVERINFLSANTPSKNLELFTPDMLIDRMIPDIATNLGREEVTDLIDRHKPNIVFIDNKSVFMRGCDDNRSSDWAEVQDWLVRLRTKGLAIVLIHHAGKNGKQRGTSRVEDIMDVILKLSHPSGYIQGEESGAKFVVDFEKARSLYGEDTRSREVTLVVENGVAIWKYKIAENAKEQSIEMFKQGVKAHEIADALNVSKSAVSKWLKSAKAEGVMS